MGRSKRKIEGIVRVWTRQTKSHGDRALVAHVCESDASPSRLYPLQSFYNVGLCEQHQGRHAQAACRNVLEGFAAIAIAVGGKLDGSRHAVKVWLQIGAPEECVGDGRNFLQRNGDYVRHWCAFGQGIEEGRREGLGVDELSGSIKSEEI